MLKLFEVSGFKNFEKPVRLDFSDVHNYEFNTECISNNMLGKVAIYGKNAIGKSNFGLALCDVALQRLQQRSLTRHGDISDEYYDPTYLNTSNTDGYAEFRYIFVFGSDEVEYIYRKDSYRIFIYEKITINEVVLFEYDRNDINNRNTKELEKLAPTLILEFENVDSSILMYIRGNVVLENTSPIKKTTDYILGMRFFSGVLQRGTRDASQMLLSSTNDHRFVYDDNYWSELQKLFDNAGIDMILEVKKDDDGVERLYAKSSESARPLLFYDIASSGTFALSRFFRLYKNAQKQQRSWPVSLIYLDEFDAYYHVELAETIVNLMKKLENTQVIITSHNTNLLSSRIMRPDCYFIMSQNKLTSLVNATDRELREGHNLAKLYRSGEFDEKQ
jgi:AAA15 family ATPase/GTPase